jgi:hypothetical protein
MRAQLTAEAILLLGGALVFFWAAVGVLVRRNGQRTGARRAAAPTQAEPRS